MMTKEERREYQRAWRAANPDKVEGYRAAIRSDRPRDFSSAKAAVYQRAWRAKRKAAR